MRRILSHVTGRRNRGRDRAAACRLRAARSRFDLSMVALRKAALDHVDCQVLVSTALRTVLDRMAAIDAKA
jgi:hypothetical protein